MRPPSPVVKASEEFPRRSGNANVVEPSPRPEGRPDGREEGGVGDPRYSPRCTSATPWGRRSSEVRHLWRGRPGEHLGELVKISSFGVNPPVITSAISP